MNEYAREQEQQRKQANGDAEEEAWQEKAMLEKERKEELKTRRKQ